MKIMDWNGIYGGSIVDDITNGTEMSRKYYEFYRKKYEEKDQEDGINEQIRTRAYKQDL